MSKSITNHLHRDVLTTFMVIALLFIALGGFMQVQWKDDNIDTVCRHLDTIIAREQNALANELFERRTPALTLRIGEISMVQDVLEVTLYDAQGTPLVHATNGSTTMTPGHLEKLDVSLLDTSLPYTFTHNFNTLQFRRPITAIGETLGWITLSFDLSQLKRQAIGFFAFFFCLLLITLACMQLLLIRRLRHSVVTPLKQLDAAMREMDASTLSVSIPSLGASREIDVLAASFQDLIARLNNSYLELDRSKEALARSEERLSRVFSATSDAIWEWSFKTGETYFSPRYYEMLGYEDQELPMTYETFKDLCHPDDFPMTEQRMASSLQTHNAKSYHAEFRMRAKDGNWRWILSRGSVIERDEEGNAVMVCGTHTDITRRRYNEEKHRLLFEASPEAIFIIKDTLITDCNPKALEFFRCTRDMLLNRPPEDISPAHQPDGTPTPQKVLTILEQLQRNGPQTFEWLHRRFDGTLFYAEVSLAAMNLLNEIHAIAFIRDISERKQVQDIMIQNEKMISVGGLAAGMAHEINNPLGGILQGVQNIKRRFQPSLPANRKAAEATGCDLEAVQNYMRERRIDMLMAGIQESGQRAADIVASLLTFSRKSEGVYATCNMIELVERAIGLTESDYDLRRNYDFRNIAIVRNYPPEEFPKVECAATEVVQVLFNIIRNAAQAIARQPDRPEKGIITVSLCHDDIQCAIDITDNGPGMDAETARRVFDPFFTTKQPGEGTGLGLSVSFQIVTINHGGTLSVDSTPGQGTTFHVRLPLRHQLQRTLNDLMV
ncbi:PAS domain S-box protein [Desulfovibrio mangrovi]|uniref:PAS domain S-box protein n=1 Tax=Desulfovibrio mangrovi TaxID=2976983 RepID=UPI0022463516|nr:PAS domain S-box protein [Desulfovibrio mangrovi]UZP66053.1 PAS domain S-box protein [Desulfovibrio mangrovi]